MSRRTVLLTSLTLIAFASNSLFCRMALAKNEIDAASFTSLRLISGALVMGVLAFRSLRPWPGTFGSAAALFLYAVPFSFAYLALGAGVGALVLFGCVQLTMIGWGVFRGERPPVAVWIGLVIAFSGLVLLAAPGASAPDPIGVGLMVIAGVFWGIYSLRGKTSKARPLPTIAASFLACLPAALVLELVAWSSSAHVHASNRGVVLAVLSGAVSSGIGYTIWYAALEGLTATRAAILQLTVPILAAIGGIAFLGEHLGARHVVSSIAVLGGVALAITRRS